MDSDEFLCIEERVLPIGQELIDFLAISNQKLPKIVKTMKAQLSIIQNRNFDDNYVPFSIREIFELYQKICEIHPIWSACMHMKKLWQLMNDYSFCSIHPSQYLIETYDEVDRLMDEESLLLSITELLNNDFRLLNSYIDTLKSFNNAMSFCLEDTSMTKYIPVEMRAYIYQTFFDNLFANSIKTEIHQSISPKSISVTGESFTREEIEGKSTHCFVDARKNNINYEDILEGRNQSFTFESLFEMLRDKEVEVTATITLHDLPDIYSLCTYTIERLIDHGIKMRKCKSCGRYFIPLNRSDEQYCYRLLENGKKCRELNYMSKINNDDYLIAYRTAYKTHNARKQRNMNNKPNAENDFKKWVERAKVLLDDARNGRISFEEYCVELKK